MFGLRAHKKKRRHELIRDIAREVISQLQGQRAWETFLPPVVLRDTVYMVTVDGKIYIMREDGMTNQPIIQLIRN